MIASVNKEVQEVRDTDLRVARAKEFLRNDLRRGDYKLERRFLTFQSREPYKECSLDISEVVCRRNEALIR
jgi:hypothetical protein